MLNDFTNDDSNKSTSPRSPNFLIAGAGESGTSWLYACLLQHPQVYMPREMRPEPHFFYKSAEYTKSYSYYLERYFLNVPTSALAIGERSSSYIFGKEVPARIKKHLPDVKLIIMLRDPIERAFSNWRFTVQSGLETASFEKAIRLEEKRIQNEKDPFWREVQPYAYLARSRYGEQIARFAKYFSSEQMLILNSNAVKKEESAALLRVCQFLAIDPNFQSTNPGTFPTSSVHSKVLQKFLRRWYGNNFDKAIERTRQKNKKREVGFRFWDLLLKANLTRKHPKLHESTKHYLSEYFIASNRQLAQYVEWNPLNWHDYTIAV